MKSDIISVTVSFNKWVVTFKLQAMGALSLILLWNKEWRVPWLEALTVRSTRCCLHVFKYVIWMVIGQCKCSGLQIRNLKQFPQVWFFLKEIFLNVLSGLCLAKPHSMTDNGCFKSSITRPHTFVSFLFSQNNLGSCQFCTLCLFYFESAIS